MNWNALRNISGSYELGRVSLALGGLFVVLTPIAFEIWEIGWNKGHFDVTAWCLAYPGGLVAFFGGNLLAIGGKEKAIATAKATLATTAQSTAP